LSCRPNNSRRLVVAHDPGSVEARRLSAPSTVRIYSSTQSAELHEVA
jgi:hypothetical protein